jgi:hypothetical protein
LRNKIEGCNILVSVSITVTVTVTVTVNNLKTNNYIKV